MKKTVISVAIAAALLSLGLAYGGDSPSGKPFEYLQEQIDSLLGRATASESDIADLQEQGEDLLDRATAAESNIEALQTEAGRYGTKVGPGLYDVHSRVLWDVGWVDPDSSTLVDGEFIFMQSPTQILYGHDRDLFLSPLKGYGIPDVQEGATRKVRLYVTYGDQWMCNGTPTVKIGDVEFYLPKISGHFAAVGAGWSSFREWDEYKHLGHSYMFAYLKDFVWDGPHCGSQPGTTQPKGVITRIEAHFYDEFSE